MARKSEVLARATWTILGGSDLALPDTSRPQSALRGMPVYSPAGLSLVLISHVLEGQPG